MNNAENRQLYESVPPLAREKLFEEKLKFYRIDNEQCEKNNIPMHQWYCIRIGIIELRRHTFFILRKRQEIINWLNKDEHRKDIKNDQIEKLHKLDHIIKDFHSKVKELEEIEKELFWFLPHEVS